MFNRKTLATAVAGGVLAVGATAAGAGAATTSTDRPPGQCLPAAPSGMTFVPPAVGPIAVRIGPTIIGGVVVDPGLQVGVPGTTIEPCPSPPSIGATGGPRRAGGTGPSAVGQGRRRMRT